MQKFLFDKRHILTTLTLTLTTVAVAQIRMCPQNEVNTFPLSAPQTDVTICVSASDAPVVTRAAQMMAADITAVTDRKYPVSIAARPRGKHTIVAGTIGKNPYIDQLIKSGKLDVTAIRQGWEQYVAKVISQPSKGVGQALVIAGCDRRGTAYGILSVSDAIGVSPWTWWSDVVPAKQKNIWLQADYVSPRPSVKYRGIFINDEDWGLKPWAACNYEKSLGDIGPRTYARVCELILRLKGNMLAPAMHPVTGAFYSHSESKRVADSLGIIITTSHCEPLLLNNAAKTEWDSKRDGEWNYATNKQAIYQKWDNRLTEASPYENIYTLAMRGVHDAGMVGNMPMADRIKTLTQVIADQRSLLQQHLGKKPTDIPQIFVPYKETMDIYENGLQVPDDATLVWVDDNYGYMKRVSNPEEQKRSGSSGVYYHLSYLGAPHDYLWICTTPPVLMYQELKKVYDTGGDRYWLLNVGDIKPMELGVQTFFDMAYHFSDFDAAKANQYQSTFLTKIFGSQYRTAFQQILDQYEQLAWTRKPEFMGFEREWDDKEHTGLHDSYFQFSQDMSAAPDGRSAQQRLADYAQIAQLSDSIYAQLPATLKDAYFEMLGFSVQGACQMNRKFLMAQLNHEMTKAKKYAEANWAARQVDLAYQQIDSLCTHFNTLQHGKWNHFMSIPQGYCALYYKKPDVTVTPEWGSAPMDLSPASASAAHQLDLTHYTAKIEKDGHHLTVIHGMGYDWNVISLGNPTEPVSDATNPEGSRFEYQFICDAQPGQSQQSLMHDSIDVTIYTVPFWPTYQGCGTTIGVCIDNGPVQVIDNPFKEYSKTWKDQVLQNGAMKKLRFPIDRMQRNHTISFITGSPGMMIQRVVWS